MYLLSAERTNESWKFLVQGASGKNYALTIINNKFKCRCIDFCIH